MLGAREVRLETGRACAGTTRATLLAAGGSSDPREVFLRARLENLPADNLECKTPIAGDDIPSRRCKICHVASSNIAVRAHANVLDSKS